MFSLRNTISRCSRRVLGKQLLRPLPLVSVSNRQFAKSWIPQKSEDLEENTVKALTWEMEQFQRKSAEKTVPWFLRNLPSQYFTEIDKDLQKDHLRALTALSEAGLGADSEEETQKLCEFAAKGYLQRVKHLVNQGANPTKGDYDGRTPFHLAASEGHTHVLKFLSEIPGANLNVLDRWGNSPLDDALRHGHHETAEFIREHGGRSEDDSDGEIFEVEQEKKTTELTLRSRNRQYTSFFTEDNKPESFRKMVSQLSFDRPISRAKGFMVRDGQMNIQVFEHGAPDVIDKGEFKDPTSAATAVLKYFEENPVDGFTKEDVEEHVLRCPTNYLQHTSPQGFFTQMKMHAKIRGNEFATAEIVPCGEQDPGKHFVYVVSPDVFAVNELQRIVTYLGSRDMNIARLHMDSFSDGSAIFRAIVHYDDESTELEAEKIESMKKDLERLKFLDDEVLDAYCKHSDVLSITEVEVINALVSMIYGPLNKDIPYAFTLDRMRDATFAEEHLYLSKDLADLFMDKFNIDNPLKGDAYAEKEQAIRANINKNVQTTQYQKLFFRLLTAINSTLRTNLYLDDRTTLMMRVDPEIMMAQCEPDRVRPYGVFFGSSRRLNGFHVRFREISRGGLRVVPTTNEESFGLESTRHFDEVYGLASAQQLKNKDIPEGGSKAVLLINVKDRHPNSREILMRRCVKYFGDGLLDLITPDEKVQKKTVDYWGKPELLYLGPDENIIPEDIVWLTERAAKRGMKYPAAFMSSKPDAGINHKVYGVTSEGVAVFLQVALQEKNIDPFKESFKVKITGGPNGDVAGNMIRILDRDYGDNAKIVGMCDHSGVVEDPNGLDMKELLRLHFEDLPIEKYSPSKLSKTGELNFVNTPEGVQKRNTMHNRLEADVFVPGGGRPNTINHINWKQFLKADGTPSSPLIVEAANIFITPEARTELGKNGVMIVKDSSANKAGVCCSSYEIVASMLLQKEEFLSIKEELVEDVLVRLREIARREALLLFREAKLNPKVQMPQVAIKISETINRAQDVFMNVLEKDFDTLDEKTRTRLMVESLPKKLVEFSGERIHDLPQAYITAMLAASLASKMVYAEGVDYVSSLNSDVLGTFAKKYLKQADLIENLMNEIENSDLQGKKDVISLLKHAGTRAALEIL